MQKVFIHHILYRLLLPLMFGLTAYVLILLVFGSFSLLFENFFSQEAVFCIALAYVLNESLRLQFMWLDKQKWLPEKVMLRLVLYVLPSVFLSAVFISGGVALYYHFLVGFAPSANELITFNSVYGIGAVLYCLCFFSILLLNRQYEEKILQEEELRKEISRQLRRFRHTIKPELFYDSLESLITLVRKDADTADEFISHLSMLYRYSLDQQKEELLALEQELKTLRHLLFLLNIRYQGNLSLQLDIPQDKLQQLVVPGTLTTLLEQITRQSIINELQPLSVSCFVEDEYLVFQNGLNERLKPELQQQVQQKISELQNTYSYFTDQPLIQVKAFGDAFIKVPLLSMN
jgi:hypothetical protein